MLFGKEFRGAAVGWDGRNAREECFSFFVEGGRRDAKSWRWFFSFKEWSTSPVDGQPQYPIVLFDMAPLWQGDSKLFDRLKSYYVKDERKWHHQAVGPRMLLALLPPVQ